MTKEQREKTKLALRRYGTRQWAACPANAGWRLAIERTIEYYQQEDPLRADLLRLRYLERRTEDDTIERLHIGRSTYQKAQSRPSEHGGSLCRPVRCPVRRADSWS